MSLMGNLIVGIPMGSTDQAGHVRPYITGGAGLFRVTRRKGSSSIASARMTSLSTSAAA